VPATENVQVTLRSTISAVAVTITLFAFVSTAEAIPAKGDLQPTFMVGEIKHRLGRYWTPITFVTPTPLGIGPQMACNGRATGKVRMNGSSVRATFGALTPTGIADCEATATFKLKRMPTKRKKYTLTLSFPGNDAFNAYKGSKKIVLRR
jgi:hypothetical protein